MIFNYDNVIRSIENSFSLHYDDYTINGGDLDDIAKTAEKQYDLHRDSDSLRIYGDNVFAVLEEDPEEGMVKGSVRKSVRCIMGEDLTYRDRSIMDLPMRF